MVSFKWQILLILFCASFGFSNAQSDYPSYFKGISSYNNGDYKNAIVHFNKALKEDVPEERIYEIRGKSFLALNNFAEAENDFQKLSKLDKSKGSYLLARCFAISGNEEKVIEQLKIHLDQYNKNIKSDIKLDENFASIKNSDAWIELWKPEWYNKTENEYADAVYHFRNKEFDMALDILNKIIEKHPRNHKAYALRTDIYFNQDNLKEALNNIDEAIRIKNKIPEYFAARANLYLELKKYRNAFDDIKRARKLNPFSIEYPLVEANVYFKLGENKKSERLLNEYISFFPDNTRALYLAGKCLFMQNKLEESLEYFSRIIELNPGEPKYFLARGNVNFALNLPDKAINDYSMALDLDPHQEKVYFSRAFAYQEIDEKERACKDFQKAFSLGYKKALVHIQEYCGE